MMFLDLLLLSNACYWNKQNFFYHINIIYFFMVLIWFLFQVVDGAISPNPAELAGVVDLAALWALLSIGQASS